MFLIDDILLFPLKSILFIFRETCNGVQGQIADEADSIKDQLSELYMRLETGQVTEKEFDAREGELLKRLDELQQYGVAGRG